MPYKIKYKNKIIAAFVNESDRDVCLGALQENYSDVAELFESFDE